MHNVLQQGKGRCNYSLAPLHIIISAKEHGRWTHVYPLLNLTLAVKSLFHLIRIIHAEKCIIWYKCVIIILIYILEYGAFFFFFSFFQEFHVILINCEFSAFSYFLKEQCYTWSGAFRAFRRLTAIFSRFLQFHIFIYWYLIFILLFFINLKIFTFRIFMNFQAILFPFTVNGICLMLVKTDVYLKCTCMCDYTVLCIFGPKVHFSSLSLSILFT